MIEVQGLTGSPIWKPNQIEGESHFLCVALNTLYSKRWNLKKTWIENIVQTFKQLRPLQAIGPLQIINKSRFIGSTKILLSNQADLPWLLLLLLLLFNSVLRISYLV